MTYYQMILRPEKEYLYHWCFSSTLDKSWEMDITLLFPILDDDHNNLDVIVLRLIESLSYYKLG